MTLVLSSNCVTIERISYWGFSWFDCRKRRQELSTCRRLQTTGGMVEKKHRRLALSINSNKTLFWLIAHYFFDSLLIAHCSLLLLHCFFDIAQRYYVIPFALFKPQLPSCHEPFNCQKNQIIWSINWIFKAWKWNTSLLLNNTIYSRGGQIYQVIHFWPPLHAGWDKFSSHVIYIG